MTYNFPWRRTILQLLQIVLIDGLTFINLSLSAINYSPLRFVIGAHFHLDSVSRQYFDAEHPQFAGQMRHYLSALVELHLKVGAGKRLQNSAAFPDNIFIGHNQPRIQLRMISNPV